MTNVFTKIRNLKIQTHTHTQGECHVNMKAEIQVMHVQAKPKIARKPPEVRRETQKILPRNSQKEPKS